MRRSVHIVRLVALFVVVALGFGQRALAQNVTVTGGTGIVGSPFLTVAAAFAQINATAQTGNNIIVSIDISTTEAGPCVLHTGAWTTLTIRPSGDGVSISGPTTTGRGLIELNGADNVTIDGDNPNTGGTNRNLTITNSAAAATTHTSAIRIATVAGNTSADNNTISNCILNGSATGQNLVSITATTVAGNNTYGVIVGPNGGVPPANPTTITSVTGTMAAGTTANLFTVNNCAVNQCARGIVFLGNTTASSTGVTVTSNAIGDQSALAGIPPYTTPTTTVYTKGMFIRGTNAVAITSNSVRNILSYIGTAISGIELEAAIGTGTISVSGNTVNGVVNNSTSANATRGIWVNNAGAAYAVDNNDVTNVQMRGGGGTAQPMGIQVSTTGGAATIERNEITQIHSRSTGSWGAYGVNLAGGNNHVVRNNFISDVLQDMSGGVTFSFTNGVFGLRIAAGTGHSIQHNAVSLGGSLIGTSANTLLSAAFVINAAASTGLTVRNNIFSNTITGGGTSIAHVSIALPSGATSAMNLTWNNNVYYSGTDAARQGIGQAGTTAGTGFYLASNFNPALTTPASNMRAYTSTLSAAGTNDNASDASTAAAPFISATNLHLDLASPQLADVSNLGATGTGVAFDIDNDARGGVPEIGADELVQLPCAGAPSAGTSAPGTINVCSGATVLMSNNAVNAFGGITYQWQVGATGGPYTDVVGGTGATTQSYTTGALTQGTYYYILRVRCGNEIVPAGDSYSNEVEVIVGAAPPAATASVVLDCDAPGFYIAVNLTSLGGAFDVNLVPSTGTPLNEVDATGVYNLGPFTSGSSVSVNVENNSDNACGLSLGSFTGTLNCINNGDCLASGVQNIPDNGCGINANLDVHFPISGMQDDLNANVILSSVDVQIEHTYRGDIQIRLISPSGQSRDLFLQKPNTAADGFNLGDLSQACPLAPLTFQDGGALLTTLDANTDNAAFGVFAPEQTLAGFTGNPNGTWTLRMCDNAGIDLGSLRHIKLNFLNMDCLGVFGGTTLPGSPCDDGNILTANDEYDANCLCSGEFVDCLAVPNGTALPGTSCDDGLATTGNDMYLANCTCAGELIDCLGIPGGSDLPTTPCDDNDAGTINDTWDGSCNCVGTPTGCQDNEVTLELGTDGAGAETSWEIIPGGGGPALCSGSGYPNNQSSIETCCLVDGCYRLLVYDSFGDGMTTGGYRLTDDNGDRIIDNWQDGVFTSTSAIANNGGFCLPLGTVAMQPNSCDQLALTPTSVVSAVPDAGVSAEFGIGVNTDDGYQFWIYDPDGSYSRTMYKSHTNPGQPGLPYGPTAAASLALNSIVTMPVPANVKLNIKVRSRVNGVNSNYGPACTLIMNTQGPNCPTTSLINAPNDPKHSCGVTGKVVNPYNKLYCYPVAGANKYQWRFENSIEGYVRTIATTGTVLTLNPWATNPLLCGTFTYDVTVHASFDNGVNYCLYGPICTVGITNSAPNACTAPFQGGGGSLHSMQADDNGMTLWPNPVREGNVTLEFTGLASDVMEMRIVVIDLFGKTVLDEQLHTDGAEQVKTTLTLGTDIASGLYVVNVTAGNSTFTERLVVE